MQMFWFGAISPSEDVRHPAVTSISDGVLALTTPVDELGSEVAIDHWLDTTVNDYVHAVGTCRMGTPGGPAAVVDTDCRVVGYDQLRVGDASVMPDPAERHRRSEGKASFPPFVHYALRATPTAGQGYATRWRLSRAGQSDRCSTGAEASPTTWLG